MYSFFIILSIRQVNNLKRNFLFRCVGSIADTVKIFLIDKNRSELILKPDDKFYIEVIYCLLSRDYSKLPIIFECDVKQEFVKFEEV
jgi:hypothetical protein